MQLPEMGPTLPTYPSAPPAPPAPLQTISHQAAGVELGCADCAQHTLGEVKALPLWVKLLAGLGIVGTLFTIISAVARRR